MGGAFDLFASFGSSVKEVAAALSVPLERSAFRVVPCILGSCAVSVLLRSTRSMWVN